MPREHVSCAVVSIGTLDANPLWNERSAARTAHTTTTLVTADDARILVDPGLPAPVLQARLAERCNLTPNDITHVFLTSFRPDARRALPAFENARWLVSETERESVGVPLVRELQNAEDARDQSVADALRQEIALLQRCEPAPDNLATGVDLFPLPGVTPGLAGLLLAEPRHTTLICGDAIPDRAHLDAGKVLPWAADLDTARESFAEAVEIADLLIPARDNILVNPTKRPF